MSTPLHRSLFLCCLLAAASVSAAARAESDAERKAAAEALFDEGRRAMDAGELGAACTAFERSDALDSAPGTLLNLADCYEKSSRMASAWATFKRAAAAARGRGQAERELLARERAAALETRLSHLTITVPEAARVAGLELTRDGAPVLAALWGAAVPVDGGEVTVRATAPGFEPWETTLAVAREAARTVIEVPPLTPAAPAPATEAAPPAPGATGLEQPAPSPPPTPDTDAIARIRPATLVLASVGGAALLGGGLFGGLAASTDRASRAHCRPDAPNLCSQRGVDLRDDARRFGDVSTAAVSVGLAALAGAALVELGAGPRRTATDPASAAAWGSGKDQRPRWGSARATVDSTTLGLEWGGTW